MAKIISFGLTSTLLNISPNSYCKCWFVQLFYIKKFSCSIAQTASFSRKIAFSEEILSHFAVHRIFYHTACAMFVSTLFFVGTMQNELFCWRSIRNVAYPEKVSFAKEFWILCHFFWIITQVYRRKWTQMLFWTKTVS